MPKTLTIATCQHPVSGNIEQNLADVIRLAKKAKAGKADIAHFPECNLSGYAGIDFSTLNGRDENVRLQALETTRSLARELKIRLIIGSHHYEDRAKKPFNSLYLIDEQGELRDRYDKRFLPGEAGTEEHLHYRPGNHPVVFDLQGIRCGLLICHEWRYPELYRQYYRLGVKVVFHSWYDGNRTKEQYRLAGKEEGALITGTARGYAANNHLWISGSNTSRRESCFPAFVAQPDGRLFNKGRRNRSGVLLSRIDLEKRFYDPSGPWRDRAIEGVLHS